MGENPEYKLRVSVFVCVIMCSQQLSGIYAATTNDISSELLNKNCFLQCFDTVGLVI